MTDHLILAALPTPNGELHLGHLGGPFLAADALARHLRAEGHRVTTVSATDGRESYVLDAARREGRAPEATARDYHARIEAALTATDCRPDVFLDVHDATAEADHLGWHHALAERLSERGRIEIRRERLLADAGTGEELVACWLAGRCPACGEEAAGYTCEACGMWFQPTDVREPRPRHPRERVTATDTASAFLRLDAQALLDMARERRVPGDYIDLVHRYLELDGPLWRLTHPLGWGVPWSTPAPLAPLAPRQVHSTYALGTTAMFLLAGREHARAHGLPHNPLLAIGPHRPHFTLCFGMDGALPLLMQLAVQEATGIPCAPDEYRFNRFMTLDGQKFSTSRDHVVRVLDYVAAGLDTDALRFHLARLSPGEKPTDFSPEAFADDITRTLAGRLSRLLDVCEATGSAPDTDAAAATTAVRHRFEDIAARHREALRTGDLAQAAAAVDDWLALAPGAVEAAGATRVLAVLAALAAPLMPRWAGRLWERLRLPATPALGTAVRLLSSDTSHLPPPAPGTLPRFAPVDAAEVRALVRRPG
ncbi:class I tRNA ligase family protein [Kitasatospora sp. MBT66]|uniref:class I tRNA ligase family protein n=1 Tax=Kitasatospora sp. MBT66 TaxID=1444769 RepID=UPI0005B78C65|nr:class I tRNA ligase family protein [Kitasatospora sp. MBT66]